MRAATALAAGLLAASVAAPALAAHPFAIQLKDRTGADITAASTVPYSPKVTCGASGCHNYALITQGYHFQQGRTDKDGNVQVSDAFSPDKPWLLSDGMYGRW